METRHRFGKERGKQIVHSLTKRNGNNFLVYVVNKVGDVHSLTKRNGNQGRAGFANDKTSSSQPN